jgi:hypothetical protein
MSHPAGGPVETVELTVTLPPELRDEIVAYCTRWKADPSWALRRAARHMLDDEAEQERRLAVKRRGSPGRRVAARK